MVFDIENENSKKYNPKKTRIMKTLISTTTSENRNQECVSVFRNSKRIQWSAYRSYSH